MKFSQLAQYFHKIEATSSRLTMTKILAELFNKLSADEIHLTAYLLQGRVKPLYEKVEFGMAEKMIMRAVASALQIGKGELERKYKQTGDVGETTEYFRKPITTLESKDLTITEVYRELLRMANESGSGSQDLKIRILSSLIRQLDALSARYITRIPLAVLRLGFSDMTVLDAYSWMQTGDKSFREKIQQAYHVRPDLGFIGQQLKQKGMKGIGKIQPQIFTPILMMRAERLSSAEKIIKTIGSCAVESKYDGFRLQVHYKKSTGEVRLYTRGLEDASLMYPDIIAGIKKDVDACELIIEGEAIGFDPETGSFLPFQETVQRKRKYDIAKKASEIPLKLFAFELLYCDGKNYVQEQFAKRRQRLTQVIKKHKSDSDNTIILSPQEITADPKRLELIFDDAITHGLEGIVAKKLDGTYQPGARGWNWIKFKRSYSSKIEDTIDCLVMGFDKGKGKRVGFGIGAFLVGIYDKKQDKFVTMAKIGTGLTDVEWRELKKKTSPLVVQKQPKMYVVDKMMDCDVWVEPSIVVEIRADEITRSPVHTAGRILKPSKSGDALMVDVAGYALRFPRLERFRADKTPAEATSLPEVEKLYQAVNKK